MNAKKIITAAIALLISVFAFAAPANADSLMGNLTRVYGDMVTGKQAPFQITYYDPRSATKLGAKLDGEIEKGLISAEYAIAGEVPHLGGYAQEQAKLTLTNNQITYRDKAAIGVRIDHKTAYIRSDVTVEAGIIDNRY